MNNRLALPALALALLAACATKSEMRSLPSDAGVKGVYAQPFDVVKRAALDSSGELGFNLPYDSPSAMRDFARRYGINDPSWEFLTPHEKQLPDLTAQMGFQYVATLAGFDHVTQLTILDAEGRVYRQVYGEEFSLPLFIEPLHELVRGAPIPTRTVADVIERIRILCTVYDRARRVPLPVVGAELHRHVRPHADRRSLVHLARDPQAAPPRSRAGGGAYPLKQRGFPARPA
ncbi:MAG: hypothetical protein HC807_05580 [Gammaproteobacteria bacterium]|nr:hypothetical protein [Gammaproteobacteria bacterium]